MAMAMGLTDNLVCFPLKMLPTAGMITSNRDGNVVSYLMAGGFAAGCSTNAC
jgi:hypothetical protein